MDGSSFPVPQIQSWRPAAGVEYRESFPGFSTFRCDAYRVTLAPAACAKRHIRAETAMGEKAEELDRCNGCLIGMAHAGREVVFRNELFGAQRCPRCGVGGSRMIADRLCVSCYNREREAIRGRNGKGRKPTFSFEPRRIGVILATGAYVEVGDEHTADLLELIYQCHRVVPGHFSFCPPRGEPAISTIELAERVGTIRPHARTVAAARAKRLSAQTARS